MTQSRQNKSIHRVAMKTLLTALGVACLCLLPLIIPPTFAKDQPPPKLSEMFDHFNILETKFNAEQWEESVTAVKQIEQDYLQLVSAIRDTVPAIIIQKFGFLITNFKLRLQKKDPGNLEKPFAQLQSLFFDIMEHYEYPAQPAFLVLAWSVLNSRQALERNDFRFIHGKMEQILTLRERITGVMQAEGVSEEQIARFMTSIDAIRLAAQQRDPEVARKKLAEIDAFVSPLAGW